MIRKLLWYLRWCMPTGCDGCDTWPTRMTYVQGQRNVTGRWVGLWACKTCYAKFHRENVEARDAERLKRVG